jgi:uncharacterized protein (DUF433 family)
MHPDGPGVQRSFRLSARTARLLDETAATSVGESRNALVDRLLGEALRLQGHPLITFRTGASGWRRPALTGTRLDVYQVIETWRAESGDVAGTAEYFGLESAAIQAAVDYYADFRDEVEADARGAAESARVEQERWERRQRALA